LMPAPNTTSKTETDRRMGRIEEPDLSIKEFNWGTRRSLISQGKFPAACGVQVWLSREKKTSESGELGEWSGAKGLPLRTGRRVEIMLRVMSAVCMEKSKGGSAAWSAWLRETKIIN
jgi:hypothetical protein